MAGDPCKLLGCLSARSPEAFEGAASRAFPLVFLHDSAATWASVACRSGHVNRRHRCGGLWRLSGWLRTALAALDRSVGDARRVPGYVLGAGRVILTTFACEG